MKNIKLEGIIKNKPIFSIWGIQDGSDRAIKGWSSFYPTHDHSICIWDNGKVINSIELERISRIKNDASMQECIEKFRSIIPEDPILVVVNDFNGNAFISKNGIIRAECDYLGAKEFIKKGRGILNRKFVETYVCSHELAHIGACLPFYGPFKQNSLLVHIDGLASKSCVSVFHYKNKKIRYIYHGFDLLDEVQVFGYNDLTTLMMGSNADERLSVPGKLMGYSSFGAFDYDTYMKLYKNSFYKDFFSNNSKFLKDFKVKNIDLNNDIYKNIAYHCQNFFEEGIIKFLNKMKKKTKAKNLYFSGGAALNINLNSVLISSGIFSQVFIPPCCSDTGLAIGAAAMVEFLRGGIINKHSPFLNTYNIEEYRVEDWGKDLTHKIGSLITQDKVIGLCMGHSETGPRALGHRSIIANPTKKDMFINVSQKIKNREWYRPIAPIVADFLVDEIFKNPVATSLADYMLVSFKVKESWIHKIPAVVHVDGTARPQIIRKDDKELTPLYELLKHMWEKYQIPCLINTSFNSRGEPIVHTYKDALTCAEKIGLDYVILGKHLRKIKRIES